MTAASWAANITPCAGIRFLWTSCKARGIRSVCAALGVPLAETMAFGDGLNDVEMFKTVGFGVAMGDAVPELRAVAQMQTGTVEEDGIYNALKKLEIIP